MEGGSEIAVGIATVGGRVNIQTELQDTPDMVLEVVSDSSVKKDLKILKKAYWRIRVLGG